VGGTSMDDKRYIIYDFIEEYEITKISECELLYLLLLREDNKILEKILFRDKQRE
jgi:hypothetical protein